MTIVPNGLPAHVRASDITTFDGDLNKKNYLDIGTIDPETDVSAEAWSRAVDILACAGQTMPFAVMTISCTDGYSPTLGYFKGFYPNTPPLLTKISDGYVTAVFATSYTDVYGVSAPFSVNNVDVGVIGIRGTPATVQYDVTNGSQVLFKVAGYTGSFTIMVRIW